MIGLTAWCKRSGDFRSENIRIPRSASGDALRGMRNRGNSVCESPTATRDLTVRFTNLSQL